MRVLLAALVAAALAGCAGSELRVGAGRSNGGGAESGGSWEHGNAGGSWATASDDDSTSLWVELGFQLSPTAVRLEDGSHLLRSPAGLPGQPSRPTPCDPPPSPAPGHCASHADPGPPSPDPHGTVESLLEAVAALSATVDELSGRVVALTERADKMKARVDRAIGPVEVAFGGGGILAVVAAVMGVQRYRRRRSDECEG